MLGELQIVVVVKALRVGRNEHERSEGASACDQRNDHRRRHAQLTENLVVLFVLRRRSEELVGDRAVEQRFAGAHRAGRTLRLVGLRCEAVHGLLGPLALVRILVHDRESPEGAVGLQDVDRVPIGEGGDEQRREVPERRLVVQRRRELLAHLGQDAQPSAGRLRVRACAFALRDVRDHDADADLLVRSVAHRVVADQPVARVFGHSGDGLLDVQVEDGLAGLEDLAMERLDLRRQVFAENLAQSAAEVCFGRSPIHPCQGVVHAHVVEARIHEREADRSGSEEGVDYGQRLLRFVPCRLCVAIKLRIVDRDRRAPREVLRHFEVRLVVAAAALRRNECDRSENSVASDERNAHRRLQPELFENLRKFGHLGRRRLEQLVGNLGEELRPARADDVGDAVRSIRIGRIPLPQLVRPAHLLGVHVRHGQPAERTVLLDHVDRAPVGEAGDRERRDVGQRRLVVQRRAEQFARLRDEPLILREPLLCFVQLRGPDRRRGEVGE